MVKSLAVAKFGVALTAGGIASMVAIRYLLPVALDSGLLFSALLQVERIGEGMLPFGAAISLVAGFMGWREKKRATQALALLGVVLAGLGIAWVLLPVALGLAMAGGGGIPR